MKDLLIAIWVGIMAWFTVTALLSTNKRTKK